MRRVDLAFPMGTVPACQFVALEEMSPTKARNRTSDPSQFREAERAQFTILTPAEKKCLSWLAHRMPAWVNSDHLTLLGFFGMLCAGLSFWLARSNSIGLLLVVCSLAVNWFGDSLDGTLARVRNQPRPKYGFYVDHMVDTFGALFLLGGMMLSGYMSAVVAAGLLISFYMLMIEIYLATYTLGTFHLSFWKLGPTELRVILAIGTLNLYGRPTVEVFGGHYLLFDVGGAVAIAGLVVTLIVVVIRHTCLLYAAEPVPQGLEVESVVH